MIATRTLTDQTSGDPYFANVSLLLHMDGTNGSTTFTDSSSNNLTVTLSGNVQISTAQSQFGGASAYFDGNGDYLRYLNASLFDISGDFTIEGWWNLTQVNQYQGFTILFCGIELDRCQWAIVGNAFEFYWNGLRIINHAYTVSNLLNTWTHLAITRGGSTIKMWINGINVASATNSVSIDLSGISLGSQQNNGNYFGYLNGYLDEFRVTKGMARYTANFTPTGPFPNS